METEKTINRLIRKFKHDNIEYVLIEPNAKAVREARLKYSIKLAESLRSGLYVKKTLDKQLREIDPTFFQEYNENRLEILNKIAETEEFLTEAKDPNEMELLARTLTLYRAQIFEEDKLFNSLYDGTADQVAEEDRLAFLAFSMIKTPDGNSLASSFDEFLENTGVVLYEVFKYQVLCWEYKLDPDWQAKLPESKALVRVEELRSEIKPNETTVNVDIDLDLDKKVDEKKQSKQKKKRTRKVSK